MYNFLAGNCLPEDKIFRRDPENPDRLQLRQLVRTGNVGNCVIGEVGNLGKILEEFVCFKMRGICRGEKKGVGKGQWI